MKWFNSGHIVIDLGKLSRLKESPYLKEVYAKGTYILWHEDIINHYRLLIYFSTLFNNCDIIEVGTNQGMGAFSLAYNQTNKVTSYDVTHQHLNKAQYSPYKIEFKLGLAHELDKEKILNSPFIFVDAEHDTIYETIFLDFLIQNNYTGIVAWDDIFQPNMQPFWEKIKFKKVDLTSIGHSSGSGLTCFGGQEVIFKFI